MPASSEAREHVVSWTLHVLGPQSRWAGVQVKPCHLERPWTAGPSRQPARPMVWNLVPGRSLVADWAGAWVSCLGRMERLG